MDVLSDIAAWAWARHHNEWSWWIRPLFLLPFCWFAFRKSVVGMIATVLALLTSMFWFPAPETPHPAVVAALAAEREYLLGLWGWREWVMTAVIPIAFLALAWAFWRRSFVIGLVVVNLMAVLKIAWTATQFNADAFLRHLAPAAAGLAICNLIIVVALRLHRRSRRT